MQLYNALLGASRLRKTKLLEEAIRQFLVIPNVNKFTDFTEIRDIDLNEVSLTPAALQELNALKENQEANLSQAYEKRGDELKMLRNTSLNWLQKAFHNQFNEKKKIIKKRDFLSDLEGQDSENESDREEISEGYKELEQKFSRMKDVVENRHSEHFFELIRSQENLRKIGFQEQSSRDDLEGQEAAYGNPNLDEKYPLILEVLRNAIRREEGEEVDDISKRTETIAVIAKMFPGILIALQGAIEDSLDEHQDMARHMESIMQNQLPLPKDFDYVQNAAQQIIRARNGGELRRLGDEAAPPAKRQKLSDAAPNGAPQGFSAERGDGRDDSAGHRQSSA